MYVLQLSLNNSVVKFFVPVDTMMFMALCYSYLLGSDSPQEENVVPPKRRSLIYDFFFISTERVLQFV